MVYLYHGLLGRQKYVEKHLNKGYKKCFQSLVLDGIMGNFKSLLPFPREITLLNIILNHLCTYQNIKNYILGKNKIGSVIFVGFFKKENYTMYLVFTWNTQFFGTVI